MEQRSPVEMNLGYFDLSKEGHCFPFLTRPADNDQGAGGRELWPTAVRALMDAAMDQSGVRSR